MDQQILTALGGLGLFLLGMLVMTDGLRRMAGDALNTWLTRFTRSPASGALTGTIATALLQSSSATTVTTVGFVAAGLMTFPQALGVVFGANLGTTVTGWMVALVGFKLKLGDAALPVVFAGMMLYLFGRGRWQHVGRTLSGFGVIFLGIEFTQAGMESFTGLLSPDRFPSDTFGGRLVLVAMGAVFTMLTRSSSAGVTIALTALSQDTINFRQAASLVIGMDVGTTVTAVLASLGSSEAARRTGFSHTIYNVFTAAGALLILDPYVWAIDGLAPNAIANSPELVLVGFHTFFNGLALVIGLPLAGPFARLVEWLVPRRDDGLARRLDDRLLAEPRASEAAMFATLRDEFSALLDGCLTELGDEATEPHRPLDSLYQDLRDTRDYLDRMNAVPDPADAQHAIADAMHALDHLRRMFWRLKETDRLEALRADESCNADRNELLAVCREIRDGLDSGIQPGAFERAEALARTLRTSADEVRDDAIRQAVRQNVGIAQTGRHLAAMRWLERMSHHVWRVCAYLGGHAGNLDPEADEPLEA